MATEENELDELHSQMARLVGPGPAATLMRHLSPAAWPDVATKADLAQFATKEDFAQFATKADLDQFATKADLDQFATKADLDQFATKEDLGGLRNDFVQHQADMKVGFANLETSLIQRLNTQTITMIFALVGVVGSISSVALFR